MASWQPESFSSVLTRTCALLEGLVPGWMVMAQASVLMLFAIFCFIAGVRRQLFKVEPLAPDIVRLLGWVLIGTNGFLSLVAATALFGIWVGPQG